MIRPRRKRNRLQARRGALRHIADDRRDDRLRVLVRFLARQAAREHFEREIASEQEAASEVTLH
jgi:hypothetical protein